MDPSCHDTGGVKTKIYGGKPIQWHFAHHKFHVDCFRIKTTCAMVQPLKKLRSHCQSYCKMAAMTPLWVQLHYTK